MKYLSKNSCIVFIFSMIIALPLLFVGQTEPAISTTENRVLAAFPALQTDQGWNKNYLSELKAWFEDNMGFRGFIIKNNEYLQYKIFHVLTNQAIILGKDNWLFRLGVKNIKEYVRNYQNLNLIQEEDLPRYARNFQILSDYLKTLDIPFITMICPSKETIYPESMPNTIYRVGDRSRTDQLITYLEQLDIDAFTPKKAFLENKMKKVLFYQNYDIFHWNEAGVLVAYQSFIERYQKYNESAVSINKEDLVYEEKHNFSWLDGAILFIEMGYNISYSKGYHSVETKNSIFEELKIANLSWNYKNLDNEKLPKILIFGDSFIYLEMFKFLNESFSDIYFVHWSNSSSYKECIEKIKPDVVMLSMVEVAVEDYVNNIKYSP